MRQSFANQTPLYTNRQEDRTLISLMTKVRFGTPAPSQAVYMSELKYNEMGYQSKQLT